MRLSQKTIVQKPLPLGQSLPADFILSEVEATVRDKGMFVIHEKAYLCPCQSKESGEARNVCKNCGGTGWIFANPTKTKMIVTGITADSKLKEAALQQWGMIDSGVVNVTALNEDKLSFMDRITLLDATAEHNQVLYPTLTPDLNGEESDSGLEGQLFAYTKYDIKSVDFVGLFRSETQTLLKLEEPADYTFRDNILLLGAQYDSTVDPCVTIRYRHSPVFHIIDITRESMISTVRPLNQGQQKIIMPIKALAKRAHLIKDVENFDGDRLLDNSWKPDLCEVDELTKFERQLRYAEVQYIYNTLTLAQKIELIALFLADPYFASYFMVDGTVVLIGNYDASGNQFPSTGGTGTGGAIEKGNEWNLIVAGTLGGVYCPIGVTIRAIIDTPGQTLANWRIYF